MKTHVTPNRDKTKLRDPLAETYKVKSCDKIIRTEPTCSTKAPKSLKIMGVTVTGLDPRLLSGAKLLINVPLQKGNKRFMGLRKDARLHVRKNTHASMEIELYRNEQSVLVLKRCELAFNKSVTIKNPASALTAKERGLRMPTSVKDRLADVTLKRMQIDEHGTVTVDGKLIRLGVLKTRLALTKQIELPNIEEAIVSALGLTDDRAIDRLATFSDGLDVKRILERLSSMLKHATYELTIKGDRARMSMFKDNMYFRGPSAPLDVSLKGMLHINSAGDLLITADGSQSYLSSSLGYFRPSIEATFSQRSDGKKQVDASINVTGTSTNLKVDMFSEQAMVNYLPRKSSAHVVVPKPQSDRQFNASVGASEVSINAHLDVKAQGSHSLERAEGNLSFDVTATNPYGKTMERGLTLNGTASASTALHEIRYERNKGIMAGTGTVKLGLKPDASVREKFPTLQAVSFNYGIELLSEGRARIEPPEFGLTRILRPVINLEGNHERVDRSATRAPLFPIGSKEYFAQVHTISGAKLRDAHEVKLLIDGINSLPERLRLMESAKESIYFQTFVFKDDECGRRYAEALVAAKQRGVRVCGIVDSLGNIYSKNSLLKPNSMYRYLRDNGVELCLYNSQTEKALRSIFRIAKKHRTSLQVDRPKSLTSVAQTVRFFDRMILACNDNSLPTEQDREQLKKAIHLFLFGNEDVEPEVLVNELREVLRDCLTSFDELLMLIKRVGKASYRAHEKYLIVDGKTAIIGGMNIADEYLLGGSGRKVMMKGKPKTAWRDSDVLLSGPIVFDIFRSFRRNWLHLSHERLPLGAKRDVDFDQATSAKIPVTFMQNRPFEDGDHKIADVILYNLRTLKAGEKAWFETAYFLPRGVLRSLQNELILAAKRGVDVRIITNSAKSTDFSPLVHASVFDIRKLLEAGARVYMRNDDRLVHAKVLVFGKNLTMMGSWNCDNLSASHNTEDMCSIYCDAINDEMTSVLLTDMNEQSHEIKLEAISAQKISKEFKSAGMLLVGELV